MTLCKKCNLEKDSKACKNCKKLYDQKRFQEKREEIIKRQKIYDASHKENIEQYQASWYQKNKLAVLAKHRIYKKEKYASNIIFKLHVNCSSSIYQAMKSAKNGSSILKFLPYTMEELKIHIENQFDNKMNWNNYGSYWQIDHIYPQSLLPYSSMTDENFVKCWSLSNLRSLEASANRKKFNKII